MTLENKLMPDIQQARRGAAVLAGLFFIIAVICSGLSFRAAQMSHLGSTCETGRALYLVLAVAAMGIGIYCAVNCIKATVRMFVELSPARNPNKAVHAAGSV